MTLAVRRFMFDESPIREAMAAVGFLPEKRLVYCRPSPSAEVRNFVYFNLWGVPKQYLAAVYGFGNVEADNFATQCVIKYGGDVYAKWGSDRTGDAITRLSLGRLAGWEPRDSINLRNLDGHSLTAQIRASVERCVLPIVSKATDRKHLLEVLISDIEPCRWVLTNGAARAAQVVYLGFEVGESSNFIRTALAKYSRHISAHITSGISATEFIERIIDDLLHTTR